MNTDSSGLHLLTGAYVLDALSETERAAFARHLTGCAACATEVEGLRATAVRLGRAVAVEPPEALRTAVLANIRGVRQLPPRAGRPESRQRRERGIVIALVGAAAAAVIAVGLGVTVGNPPRSETGIAQPAVDPAGLVLTAPDAVTRRNSDDESGTTVVISRAQGKLVVVPGGLTPPDAAHVHQVWLLGPAGPVSAGLLATGAHPRPVVAAVPPGTDRVGITVEPAGGSRIPSTPAISMIFLA